MRDSTWRPHTPSRPFTYYFDIRIGRRPVGVSWTAVVPSGGDGECTELVQLADGSIDLAVPNDLSRIAPLFSALAFSPADIVAPASAHADVDDGGRLRIGLQEGLDLLETFFKLLIVIRALRGLRVEVRNPHINQFGSRGDAAVLSADDAGDFGLMAPAALSVL